ncbi:MAG: glutathione S-transferase N-terminal domain-containing protein [Proteobacteria bacterium]|nr:glutathione S-transferase N-terminal domain-containing protein [Pseudomonadota bacterium]
MKLYMSGNSPYGRRARVAAREGGLMDRIEEVFIKSFDDLLVLGPGGKIPILVTDTGVSLCESLIITRYFDDLSGGKLLPRDPQEKLACVALESVACVLMDSMFVRSMEKNQRDQALRSEAVLTRESKRAQRCYDVLEQAVARNDAVMREGAAITLASIAVISSLGYANWRHPEDEWRTDRPQLAACYDRLMLRESFSETAPVF